MPFKSEKQRRFLWAEHPDIAKRWADEYPTKKKLPMYAHKNKAKLKDIPDTRDVEEKNSSFVNNPVIISKLVNNRTISLIDTVHNFITKTDKTADSKQEVVDIPHSSKPVYAGEERSKGEMSGAIPDSKNIGGTCGEKGNIKPTNAINELLTKLSVVLSPKIEQTMENMRAEREGRVARRIGRNRGLKQYPQASINIPPPMGMAQNPQQNTQQAQAQPQASQYPARQMTPVGGGSHPQFNPINSFGGLSASGVINGNAAFGAKNSPDSSKISSVIKQATSSAVLGKLMDPSTVTPVEIAELDDEFVWDVANNKYAAIDALEHDDPAKAAHVHVIDINTATEKAAGKQLGLWDRIRMKKERGGKPAKPGDKDYPDSKSWKKVTSISEKSEKEAGSPAWQRAEGKNEAGGLNAKGRASYNKATGGNLKAPVTEKNPTGKAKARRHSFCSRMCGMKRVNTGASTAKDPDSRINKSLRKWNCKCSSALVTFGEKCAIDIIQTHKKHKVQPIFPSQLRDSTITKQEAQQIAKAMASAAPHGALDNTRVDLYGTQVHDLQQRMVDNPRSAPLQRYMAKFESIHGLPDKTQMLPDAYHPHADTVWLPSGNPAVMMHELGHSIDFNAYPNSTPRMLGAGLYARLAPTLWKEHAAWNKGRKYFLEGAAEHKLPTDLVVKTLRDTERARRMGLGSYWGAGIGGLVGGGLGALGTYALANNGYSGRGVALPLLLGLSGGGALGAMTGTSLGNMAAESPDHDNPEAQQRYLNNYAQAYAKKHDVSMDEAQDAIQKLVRKKLNSKKKKKAPKPALKKAAGHEKQSLGPLAAGLYLALEALTGYGTYQWGRHDGYQAGYQAGLPTTMQRVLPPVVAGLGGLGLGALGYRSYMKNKQKRQAEQQPQQQEFAQSSDADTLPLEPVPEKAASFSMAELPGLARNNISKVMAGLFDNEGVARLPADTKALRQALISAGVGGSIGGVKGYLFPGYDEKLDEEGRVISKKKIKPWVGALQQAGIGAGTGALANYAGQAVARYNPEIDSILFGKS